MPSPIAEIEEAEPQTALISSYVFPFKVPKLINFSCSAAPGASTTFLLIQYHISPPTSGRTQISQKSKKSIQISPICLSLPLLHCPRVPVLLSEYLLSVFVPGKPHSPPQTPAERAPAHFRRNKAEKLKTTPIKLPQLFSFSIITFLIF